MSKLTRSSHAIFLGGSSAVASSAKIKVKITLHRECQLKGTAAAEPDPQPAVPTHTIAAEVGIPHRHRTRFVGATAEVHLGDSAGGDEEHPQENSAHADTDRGFHPREPSSDQSPGVVPTRLPTLSLPVTEPQTQPGRDELPAQPRRRARCGGIPAGGKRAFSPTSARGSPAVPPDSAGHQFRAYRYLNTERKADFGRSGPGSPAGSGERPRDGGTAPVRTAPATKGGGTIVRAGPRGAAGPGAAPRRGAPPPPRPTLPPLPAGRARVTEAKRPRRASPRRPPPSRRRRRERGQAPAPPLAARPPAAGGGGGGGGGRALPRPRRPLAYLHVAALVLEALDAVVLQAGGGVLGHGGGGSRRLRRLRRRRLARGAGGRRGGRGTRCDERAPQGAGGERRGGGRGRARRCRVTGRAAGGAQPIAARLRPLRPAPSPAALAAPGLEERLRFPARSAAARGTLGAVVPGGRRPRTWSGRSRRRRARA